MSKFKITDFLTICSVLGHNFHVQMCAFTTSWTCHDVVISWGTATACLHSWAYLQTNCTGSAELMTETQHTSIIVVKYRTTVLFLNPQMLSKHYL